MRWRDWVLATVAAVVLLAAVWAAWVGLSLLLNHPGPMPVTNFQLPTL